VVRQRAHDVSTFRMIYNLVEGVKCSLRAHYKDNKKM
jgi:hypothetical protein